MEKLGKGGIRMPDDPLGSRRKAAAIVAVCG
jgi:hypothetical protein